MTTNIATPQNATLAMRGVSLEDIPSIVAVNAARKSSNGKTIVTNKGKVSLLTACIGEVRSKLGLPEHVDGDASKPKTRIDDIWVNAIKQAIDCLIENEVDSVLDDAKRIGAAITIRRNFLASKVNAKTGEIGVELKSVVNTAKAQAKNSKNYLDGVFMAMQSTRKTVERMREANKPEDAKKLATAEFKLARYTAEWRKLTTPVPTLAEIAANCSDYDVK